MKKTLFISLLLTVILFGNLSAQVQHFTWQGTEREYLIRVPSQHTGPLPVLFFLHGLGDNITEYDQTFNFGQIAEEFGWAIVAPQALNQGVGAMWNAGLMASSIDDAGFLMALLDSLTIQYQLDPDSVFFSGFSMGGFMTHRMAIEHGDRITACAPVSGLITNSMANLSAVPVRMLHIHGTSDPVVGYDGGSQYFGMNLGLSVEAILNYWINANHCVAEPVIDTFPDLKNDGLRFVRYTYEGEAELQHIKVIGGNHSWYMSEDQYDIGYLTEIHKFFVGNGGGNVGVTEPVESTLRLWPNPTSGCFTIETETTTAIEVVDLLGRCVARYDLQPGSHRIDLSDHSEGLYFIKEGNGTVTKLLLIK